MSSRKLLASFVLCLAMAPVALAAKSPEQIEQDIGYKVYCMCGCVAALNHCPHENCATKADMHQIIRADLAQGKAEPAILQDLVDRYGEKVLASPPPHGFNLSAWILPGVGLILGFLLALTIVRRWRRPAPQAPAPAAPMDAQVRAAVEAEMQDLLSEPGSKERRK